MEIEEEVVVGWQGSVFLWFLLPNGTSVAGPNTTEPPPSPDTLTLALLSRPAPTLDLLPSVPSAKVSNSVETSSRTWTLRSWPGSRASGQNRSSAEHQEGSGGGL